MGNCLETWTHCQEGEKRQQEEEAGGSVKEDGSGKGGFRVKIILTKEELEWLMFQLNDRAGKRVLEDVLGEIERERERIEVWKPSLESIMEIPEVHEMNA
ncbi:hypothetical protein HHK36_000076 [Tetracentron sinense]|uniref:Uncharacterized protein n=1 Tax=Tetracentron sinense TaxID=13715 RepID=A0A834ZVB2_TETSI|nr:hypothetical protein HHK36_000076 [Tetracentron sinense]